MAYYKTCRSTHLNKYPDTCATNGHKVSQIHSKWRSQTDRHINRTLATLALWGWHLVTYQANLRQPTSTGLFCRLCGWAKETKEHKGCGGTTCPGSHSPLDFQNGPLKWPFWKSMQPDFRWKQNLSKPSFQMWSHMRLQQYLVASGSREVAAVFHLRYHETWVTDPPMMLVQTMKP